MAGVHPVAVVDTRHEYARLQDLYLPIAVGVFVLVLGLVVLVVLRFRARGDRLPSRRRDAPILEGLYVVVLALIAAFLVGATFRTESRVDRVAKRRGLDVRVIAAKWRWRFDYPALGISQVGTNTVPSTLVVPAHTTIRFEMTSVDVIHSFWIPDVRFKRDAFPRRSTRFDLVFDHTGFHSGGGSCAEYCGLGHSNMIFGVDVRSPADFARWSASRSSGRGTAP